MKIQEIRDLSTSDLKERLAEERKSLNKLKMNHAVSPVENPLSIRDSRRTIARMLTELRKRELNVNE